MSTITQLYDGSSTSWHKKGVYFVELRSANENYLDSKVFLNSTQIAHLPSNFQYYWIALEDVRLTSSFRYNLLVFKLI